jgi:tetraacyldisaccharide 4'-kinase
MRRRRDRHRFIRWLWTSPGLDARLVRAVMVPASGLWALGSGIRRISLRLGLTPVRRLGRPTIAVGNLSLGGSGKTPLADWIAAYYAAHGKRPGILLRGVGNDETLLHRDAVPSAVVVADPDRAAGAVQAIAAGADVLVLDDAYQRLDIARDLNVCLVSAESSAAARWLVPAGPWRERWRALDRADVLIITRKRADAAAASTLAERLRHYLPPRAFVAMARLDLATLHGMISGAAHAIGDLEGRRVVAASAIADPAAFVAQLKRAGALVQVATWEDHHQFQDRDLAWLAHASRRADYVVLTAKDAVKLRRRWPSSVPEPLVAGLTVTFEAGEELVRTALDRVVASES